MGLLHARPLTGGRAKGVACILASAAGFAAMAACVRLCDSLGGPVSSFQKSFFRNLVALAIAWVAFARGGGLAGASARGGAGGKRGRPLLALRCFAGCAGIFANFYALSRIPIGEAMALNKTAPFFTVLFSWLFLRERASVRQFICLAAAFAGAALVMKPGVAGGEAFAAFCGLGGGLGAGLAYTCVRELGILRADPVTIVLVFSAFSCVAAVPFFAFDPSYMTCGQTLALLGAGCGAAVGQFGVTAAYRYAPAREIAIFDYSGVIFAAILGWALFGQEPDACSAAGFACIVAAAFANGAHRRVAP